MASLKEKQDKIAKQYKKELIGAYAVRVATEKKLEAFLSEDREVGVKGNSRRYSYSKGSLAKAFGAKQGKVSVMKAEKKPQETAEKLVYMAQEDAKFGQKKHRTRIDKKSRKLIIEQKNPWPDQIIGRMRVSDNTVERVSDIDNILAGYHKAYGSLLKTTEKAKEYDVDIKKLRKEVGNKISDTKTYTIKDADALGPPPGQKKTAPPPAPKPKKKTLDAGDDGFSVADVITGKHVAGR